MSFVSWLFRTEQRAVDASAFGRNNDVDGSPATDSGLVVDHQSALRLISVYACITLISDSVSTMPVDLFYKTEDGRREVSRRPTWLEQPNGEQSWQEFVDRVMHCLLTWGNAYIAITGRDNRGFPSEMWTLHPQDVQVSRDRGRKRYLWTPQGEVFNQYNLRYPDGDVLHIMGHSADGVVGMSPIEFARQGIGLGLATEKFGARFFGSGAQMSGILEMPTGSVPTDEQITRLGREFRRKFSGTDNAWKPVVLANGATWKPITLPNDTAQFIESRKFSVEEIARLYRVPPHKIGSVDKSTSWGSGIEEQSIGFVTDTLNPWISRLERSMSSLVPRGQYVKWNTNSIMRGDMTSRFGAYAMGVQNGWMNRNEVRTLEDLPLVDGLDEYLIPVSQAQPQEPTP